MAMNYVKFIRGTPEAFKKLTVKDKDTLYFISETDSQQGSLYLGNKIISESIASLEDLNNVLIEDLQDKNLLSYDAGSEKWINKSIIDTIGIMTGAKNGTQGGAGLVPAPGIEQQDYFLRGDGVWAPIEAPGDNNQNEFTNPTQIFEVVTNINESDMDAISRITKGKEVTNGDVAIVKILISNEKYSYTAYIYNGSQWGAMDGNYRADNVYFDEDFIFTKSIGTVSIPSSGNTTVSAAGKSLQEFFAGLFAEEENPSIPATKALLTSGNIGEKEVGTNIGVEYAFNVSSGNYAYGPSNNGVIWSNYKATFNGETLSGKTGTFSSVQVTDDTNLTITGSVEQSSGAIPFTNLGNEYPSAQIPPQFWKELSKGTLTGYRAWFCGYKNGENALPDPKAITGAEIRALGNSLKGAWVNSMDVSQMKQMFFAAPVGQASRPSVKDAATTAPQTVLGPITVYVKGANNYATVDAPDGIAYEVWYVSNADAAAGEATLNISRV